MAEETKEVKVEFTKAADYKIFAATGAWGGVNPQQEIVFDLYVERREFVAATLEIREGKLVREVPEGGRIIRERQAGFVMRPDIARSVGEWLIKKAEEAGLEIVSEQEGKNGE